MAETSLNRLLLILILKSHRSCCVEKGVLKNFTGKHFLEPLFDKVAGLRACNTGVLKTTVSSCNSLFTVHEKKRNS